jgi:hypothetical protein
VIRRIAAVVAAAAIVVTLAGCAPTTPIPTPAPSDIIGTWHHGTDTMTINADGTFTLKNVPLGVIEQRAVAAGTDPAGPEESVQGTWAIGSGGTDAGGAPGVQLDFVKPKKVGFDYGLTLVVGRGITPGLYVFLGRPDSDIRYSFTR